MDFKDLIEQAMEDGTLNTEKLNEVLGENYISKEDSQKQVNGASKRLKTKYEKQLSEANNPKEEKEVETEQKQAVDIEKEINKAMTNFYSNQETEKQINKQLEAVKPEFRDFVKHTMQNSEDFDMDAYLKENSQFKDSVTTRGEQTTANGANSKIISEEDKRILAMLDKM